MKIKKNILRRVSPFDASTVHISSLVKYSLSESYNLQVWPSSLLDTLLFKNFILSPASSEWGGGAFSLEHPFTI
jgi:hypothetical protein